MKIVAALLAGLISSCALYGAPAKSMLAFPKNTKIIKVGKKQYVKTIEQALFSVGKVRGDSLLLFPLALVPYF